MTRALVLLVVTLALGGLAALSAGVDGTAHASPLIEQPDPTPPGDDGGGGFPICRETACVPPGHVSQCFDRHCGRVVIAVCTYRNPPGHHVYIPLYFGPSELLFGAHLNGLYQ